MVGRGRYGPLFQPGIAARGHGRHGFRGESLTRRAVQRLAELYVERLKLDSNVTVHSFRVTALTKAREHRPAHRPYLPISAVEPELSRAMLNSCDYF